MKKRQENPDRVEREVKKIEPEKKIAAAPEQPAGDFEVQAEQVLASLENAARPFEEAALNAAETINEARLAPEQKDEFRDKLKRRIKKMLRLFAFATTLAGAAGAADYSITRYSVNSSTDEKGENTFAHQDEETTHVIDVLSGKERINDSDKREMLIEYLTDELEMMREEGKGMDITASDLEKMRLDELWRMAQEIKGVFGGDYEIITDPGPKDFDPGLYKALWSLEQECGNPKIRFRLGQKRKMMGFHDAERSYYNPLTNTAFIDLESNEITVDNYVGELAHGKQFNEHFIASGIAIARDAIGVIKNALSKETDEQTTPDDENGDLPPEDEDHRLGRLGSGYEKLYQQPGTLEFDAHRVIEPKLKSQLKRSSPTKSGKKD